MQNARHVLSFLIFLTVATCSGRDYTSEQVLEPWSWEDNYTNYPASQQAPLKKMEIDILKFRVNVKTVNDKILGHLIDKKHSKKDDLVYIQNQVNRLKAQRQKLARTLIKELKQSIDCPDQVAHALYLLLFTFKENSANNDFSFDTISSNTHLKGYLRVLKDTIYALRSSKPSSLDALYLRILYVAFNVKHTGLLRLVYPHMKQILMGNYGQWPKNYNFLNHPWPLPPFEEIVERYFPTANENILNNTKNRKELEGVDQECQIIEKRKRRKLKKFYFAYQTWKTLKPYPKLPINVIKALSDDLMIGCIPRWMTLFIQIQDPSKIIHYLFSNDGQKESKPDNAMEECKLFIEYFNDERIICALEVLCGPYFPIEFRMALTASHLNPNAQKCLFQMLKEKEKVKVKPLISPSIASTRSLSDQDDYDDWHTLNNDNKSVLNDNDDSQLEDDAWNTC